MQEERLNDYRGTFCLHVGRDRQVDTNMPLSLANTSRLIVGVGVKMPPLTDRLYVPPGSSCINWVSGLQ